MGQAKKIRVLSATSITAYNLLDHQFAFNRDFRKEPACCTFNKIVSKSELKSRENFLGAGRVAAQLSRGRLMVRFSYVIGKDSTPFTLPKASVASNMH